MGSGLLKYSWCTELVLAVESFVAPKCEVVNIVDIGELSDVVTSLMTQVCTQVVHLPQAL